MGLLNEIKEHKYRAWKTGTVGLLFAALGLHSGIFGPAMIDLAFQVGASIPEISRILPVRAFGNMIGSALCGFALEFLNMQVVCISSFALVCLSINLIPFCYTLYQLYGCMALNGVFCGFLVNSGNVFIIHSWGKENGAFFSPFIAEPFLKEISDLNNLDNSIASNLKNNSIISDDVLKIPLNDSKIYNAFYIIGLISILIWIVYFITYLKQKTSKEHDSRQNKKMNVNIPMNPNNLETNNEKHVKFYQIAILVILAAFFNHITYGLELSYGAMLPNYARVSKLRFNKKDASYVTSLYWICYTCFRVACIPLSTFISPVSMLTLDMVLIFISNCFLAPLLYFETAPWLLWCSSSIIGFGVSSVYATLWGFLENVMPVSGKVISVINSCAVMGEFIVPTIIGAYIEQFPSIFVYVILIYSFFGYIFFTSLALWAYFIKK